MELAPDFCKVAAPSRRWWRHWWVYLLACFVGVWFGAAPLANYLGAPSGETPGGFTTNPGTVRQLAEAGTAVVDVVTADDPAKGPADAPISIVEFGDFQCPFCLQAEPIIRALVARYPEAIRLQFRDYPVVEIHPEAVPAAEAAGCAEAQGKYWPYHAALYDRQNELGPALYVSLARELKLDLAAFNRCQQNHEPLAEIQDDFQAGVAAGVRGTPTWFINGRRAEGALPAEVWDRIVREELTRIFSGKQR